MYGTADCFIAISSHRSTFFFFQAQSKKSLESVNPINVDDLMNDTNADLQSIQSISSGKAQITLVL